MPPRSKPKRAIREVLEPDLLALYTSAFKKLAKIYNALDRKRLSYETAIANLAEGPKDSMTLPDIIAIGLDAERAYFRNDHKAMLKHEAQRELLSITPSGKGKKKLSGANKDFHVDVIVYGLTTELAERKIRSRYELLYGFLKDLGYDVGSDESHSVRVRYSRLRPGYIADILYPSFILDPSLRDDFAEIRRLRDKARKRT